MKTRAVHLALWGTKPQRCRTQAQRFMTFQVTSKGWGWAISGLWHHDQCGKVSEAWCPHHRTENKQDKRK
eukprot:6481457-Amphidinium_carterae.1